MKHMLIITAVLLSTTLASAQDDRPVADPIRPLPELFEALRTETRPVDLIDAYMEYSRVVFDDRDFAPEPGGFPWEVAERRIAENPALYAPEIRRRLLDLLPERIDTTDQLAALSDPAEFDGMGGLAMRLRTLTSLTEALGRQHAEPILRAVWNRSSQLLHQAEPLYDQEEARVGNDDIEPSDPIISMVNAMGFLWEARLVVLERAEAVGSTIFVDDVLSTLERTRLRPEDMRYAGFAGPASEYLLPFVEQRPDIYARLLPLADQDEMVRLGGGADNLAYTIKGRVGAMRQKLMEAGKLPPEE